MNISHRKKICLYSKYIYIYIYTRGISIYIIYLHCIFTYIDKFNLYIYICIVTDKVVSDEVTTLT